MSKKPGLGRNLFWLCVKFAILAPLCLVLWLMVLPYYSSALGEVSLLPLRTCFGYDISDVQTTVDPGVLNTGTRMVFTISGRYRMMPDVGHLTANIAPFIALILATTGITLRRRFTALGIGVGIIFVSHVLTILLRFTAGRTPFPTAIGFISITLPFLLWIVLAYREKVMEFLLEQSPTPAPAPAPPTAAKNATASEQATDTPDSSGTA